MASSNSSSLSGKELYECMKKYSLTERQLRDFGFPRSSDDGRQKAKFYTLREKTSLKDYEKLCSRCGKIYDVTEDGTPAIEQECLYHCGKKNRTKAGFTFVWIYECCNRLQNSVGCTTAKTHVYETNEHESLDGFVESLPAPESDPRNYKIFSLDGEMIYTKAGLELARVTLVGERGEMVYESLIKPDADIVDYNTRFSGIVEDDMKGVKKTLCDIQTDIQGMISDKTILIGHSLNHDLVKLKLIHDTVVDTSIVFPHKRGLPYRRALRNLVTDYLKKTIQSNAGGHDSKEDAMACMELMIYKVKQANSFSSLQKLIRSR